MRCRLLAAIALFGFFLALTPASSQAQSLEASAGAAGAAFDVNGNKAKFHEYSDHSPSVLLGKGALSYDSPGYFLDMLVRDPGYDTQHYRVDGGAYGKVKGWFDYNEIVHNLTFDAKTFYLGAGSQTLTGAANQNPAAWPTAIDYYTLRKKVDAGLSFSIPKPFFFTVSYMDEKKSGVMPVGVATGSPGAASLELPTPIDYHTTGFVAEGGYAKKPYFVSFSYAYSEFKNHSQDLFFTPVGSSSGILSLPPDNTFYKFALKGGMDLPFHSKFTVNLGDARTTSDSSDFTAATFDGKIDTRNYDFALASKPLPYLDTNLFYKYYQRDNRSSGQVPVNTVLTTTTPLYYQNNTYGAEAGLRLPLKFYLSGGYKYVETGRRIENLDDPAVVLPYTWDNVYTADLKWTGLDFAVARLGFERLNRGADYRNNASEAVLNRQFAYAAQNRDTFKTAVDLAPMESLNVGLEYRYKKSNYNDTAFGVTSDKTNAGTVTADYAFRKFARFYGYADYEKTTLDQREFINTSPWESTQDDRTYGYGFRSDLYVIPKKLTFILQYDYLKANGDNDFTFFDNLVWGAVGVPPFSPVDIAAWDDYQKYSARFTAVYQWSESLSTKLGYAYERYKYSDAQLNGYRYFAGGPGSSQAYLTGAYSNPSYSANIVFLSLNYKFR
jgi:MtrB/PioB family decaheme-associated outer membrane protein